MQGIYLDHNATTPIHPEVVAAMDRVYAQGLANPASQHVPGQQARKLLEDARERIAEILGANLTCPRPDRLVFTASATEANNLAILGMARAAGGRPGQVIISSVEHPSVIEPAEHLLECGWRLDTLPVTPDGVVRSEMLAALLGEERGTGTSRPSGLAAHSESGSEPVPVGWARPTAVYGEANGGRSPPYKLLRGEERGTGTSRPSEPAGRSESGSEPVPVSSRLVSVLLGNHDTGVLQPVAELAAICNRAGAPLHTDAAQVVGKMPVSFGELGVAAMSFGAHKFRGPLGIGGLLLRHDAAIEPLLFGGHQQGGLRPGTESVALAAGMLAALEIWQREARTHARHLTSLRQRFEGRLKAEIAGLVIHAESAPRLPQTGNIAFPDVDGQVLLVALSMAGVACSVGSACSSGSTELSPTLRAMGVPSDVAGRSLRFSLGGTNTEAEIDEAAARIVHVWQELRG